MISNATAGLLFVIAFALGWIGSATFFVLSILSESFRPRFLETVNNAIRSRGVRWIEQRYDGLGTDTK